MTDREERRQEAALRGIVEVAELATINISKILADKIREQRNAQQNNWNRQQNQLATTNDEHNYALQAPNGHGQQQNPLDSMANMTTSLASSRSMNAASGINNGGVVEDSDDEIRIIGIENGPGTSLRRILVADQVASNNQQIDVQSPPMLSPATTLETAQQASTPSSSYPMQTQPRQRLKFPNNPIVDQLIYEYAKWSLDNTSKAGSLQLLMKSITKVIGEDASKHKYGIGSRIGTARKMIREERARQQQIHPNNNEMPLSTSFSCSQPAIPVNNVLIEQDHLLNRAQQEQNEANENEADEQDQNEIMEPSEKDDPLMNLMERFEAKFDQNVVRNIDTPREGDQVEVGYEEVDVNASADRGNLGNEEPQLAENDAETTFTSSMTEGFLDDANDTRVDCEEVQQRPKDLMKKEAEEQSPEKRIEQRPEEEENGEEEENIENGEEEENMENREEENMEIWEEQNMENREEENMESGEEENPQNSNMENASATNAIVKQLTSPAVENSSSNLVERMEMDILPPSMQGAKLLMGKQVAKRHQPFKKPNSQNPGLVRMFTKIPNKSQIVSLVPVLNEEIDLIVKKTLLLSIRMNEGKMNSADVNRGIKQESRSEFDDIAKSMRPDEEEEDVQQADGQSDEPVPKRMAVEPTPPLFRPPPLFKHGRLQIVRVMIDSYRENKKAAKTLKVNKKSVKKLPKGKSSIPSTSAAALKAKTPKSATKPQKKRRRLNTPSSIPSTSSAATRLQQSPSRRYLKRGNVNAEAEATYVQFFHDKLTPEWKSRLMFNGSIRCNECDPHSEWSLSAYPTHMLKEHSIFIRETVPVVEYLSNVDDAETFQKIVWRCEYCKQDFDTVDEYAAHVEADEEHRAKAPKRKVPKKYSIEHIKQIRDRILDPNSN